jgi:ATPase family associated with various cellular activities (AAA)
MSKPLKSCFGGYLIPIDTPKTVDERSLSLIDKYRPKYAYQVLTHDITFATIKQWIQNFKERNAIIKKCLVISGVSGIGKNILAKLLLQEEGYTVHVVSCHELKGKAEFADYLYELSHFCEKDQPKALIVSNIDALGTLGDTGGCTAELVQFLNPLKGVRTKHAVRDAFHANYWKIPVICICNTTRSGKILDILKVSDHVEFKRPPKQKVIHFFKNVINKENLKIDNVEKLVDMYQGDIRQTFLNLWRGGSTTTKGTFKDVSFDTDDCMSYFFSKGSSIDTAQCLRLFYTDSSLLPILIFENYPDASKDIHSIANVADSLSISDTFDHYIFANQCWDMTDYVGAAGCAYPVITLKEGAGSGEANTFRQSKVWSKISNMHSKMIQCKELFATLHTPKDLQSLYTLRDTLYQTLQDGGVEGFIRLAMDFDLDPEHVYMLMKISSLSPIKTKYTLAAHAKIKKAWALLAA